MKDGLLEIIGSVEQIVFRNENNGYTVINFAVSDELITAVGTMPYVGVGEELKLIGTWKNHPNFGDQFSVECLERSVPTNAEGIFKYLSSGAIKGVGKVIASKLVDKFGDETLKIIENNPERLSEVNGITKNKAIKISEEFKKVFGIRELMVYLSEFGITAQEAVHIWKVFGEDSLDTVKEDPYIISREPINIDFDKADEIAISLERPNDDIYRVRAGIVHILCHNMNNGHTCLPEDKLILAAESFLGVNEENIVLALESLKSDLSLVEDIISERKFIFTNKMYECENYCANRILMMLKYPAQSITGIDKHIKSIEKENNIKYEERQVTAITEALAKGILILTGGPGTGKTTTLNAIIKILQVKGEKVFLAAPTGRAAKRMSEVTGNEAKTIHRMLEVAWDNEDNPIFKRNEKNLLECDALILDELSMVDTSIFEAVLRALPLGCRLIMVGDSDQLPSVGPGNILGDLINSKVVPVVQLTEIFRQAMNSLIVTNAHRIVSGKMPELSVKNNDFFFLDKNDPTLASDTIVDLYNKRLPNAYGYSPLFDIQVLCPSRKGELGTIELNKKIQAVINKADADKKEININGVIFREGDKVMQIKNNYDIFWAKSDGTSGQGVFNGDIGILVQVDKLADTIVVQYEDRFVVYNMQSINNLELAYAITIHKSQGSEFDAVIMPMLNGINKLKYRNLLYTGVTRAKSIIVMVGSKKTVEQMVENNRKTKRFSGLCKFLLRSGNDE